MPRSMRIGLVSFGTREFSALHATCTAAGHLPTVYVYGRSLKPRRRSDEQETLAAGRILRGLPLGMDLLLPGTADGLAAALAGYELDLLLVYGFSWKLPPAVLRLPRFGVLNIHSSALPRYRGPAPVLWAIRNGDPTIGITVHRMDEDFDTGPILAQHDGIPLEEDVTPDSLWQGIRPVLRTLLGRALDSIVRNDPGIPQDDAAASYAGFMEPDFSVIDWSRTAREVHNQVRTFRFMGPGLGPVAEVDGRWLKVLCTRLEKADGRRVECADGPLWIVASAPAEPPADAARQP